MEDMFDLGEKTEPKAEPKADARSPKPQPPLPPGAYIVQNVIPVFPGWTACYDDMERPGQVISFPVIGLAMVVLHHPDGRVEQTLRHLVSTPAGQIDDVNEFPNFICVVAPGQAPEPIIETMRKLRDVAS